jgi:hypothetical protein
MTAVILNFFCVFNEFKGQNDPVVCNKSNMVGATCGTGTAYTSGAHEFTPGYSGFVLLDL